MIRRWPMVASHDPSVASHDPSVANVATHYRMVVTHWRMMRPIAMKKQSDWSNRHLSATRPLPPPRRGPIHRQKACRRTLRCDYEPAANQTHSLSTNSFHHV